MFVFFFFTFSLEWEFCTGLAAPSTQSSGNALLVLQKIITARAFKSIFGKVSANKTSIFLLFTNLHS